MFHFLNGVVQDDGVNIYLAIIRLSPVFIVGKLKGGFWRKPIPPPASEKDRQSFAAGLFLDGLAAMWSFAPPPRPHGRSLPGPLHHRLFFVF
jgi:hypothetical protein